jgi:hypothetical protein
MLQFQANLLRQISAPKLCVYSFWPPFRSRYPDYRNLPCFVVLTASCCYMEASESRRSSLCVCDAPALLIYFIVPRSYYLCEYLLSKHFNIHAPRQRNALSLIISWHQHQWRMRNSKERLSIIYVSVKSEYNFLLFCWFVKLRQAVVVNWPVIKRQMRSSRNC